MYICTIQDKYSKTMQEIVKEEKSTQREAVAKELKNLLPNITKKDRKEVKEELSITIHDLNNYVLKGQVTDIDLGLSMLKFLKERQVARANELKEIQKIA